MERQEGEAWRDGGRREKGGRESKRKSCFLGRFFFFFQIFLNIKSYDFFFLFKKKKKGLVDSNWKCIILHKKNILHLLNAI